MKDLTASGFAVDASAGWAKDEVALEERPRARGTRRPRKAGVERIILGSKSGEWESGEG